MLSVSYVLPFTWSKAGCNSRQRERLRIEEFCPGIQPIQSYIAVFRARTQTTPAPFGSEGEVYLAIALTPWTSASGVLVFITGDVEEEVQLEPGDGILWRGECLTGRGSGHGGVFILLRFGPGGEERQAVQG